MISVLALMLVSACVTLFYPEAGGLVVAFAAIAISHSLVIGFSQIVRGMQSIDDRLAKLESRSDDR